MTDCRILSAILARQLAQDMAQQMIAMVNLRAGQVEIPLAEKILSREIRRLKLELADEVGADAAAHIHDTIKDRLRHERIANARRKTYERAAYRRPARPARPNRHRGRKGRK